MNFYIGMTIEELDYNDYNVRINEDDYEFYLYKGFFEFQKLDKTDPYGDTILQKK